MAVSSPLRGNLLSVPTLLTLTSPPRGGAIASIGDHQPSIIMSSLLRGDCTVWFPVAVSFLPSLSATLRSRLLPPGFLCHRLTPTRLLCCCARHLQTPGCLLSILGQAEDVPAAKVRSWCETTVLGQNNTTGANYGHISTCDNLTPTCAFHVSHASTAASANALMDLSAT